MNCLDKFADITRRDELLAPYTWLKLGGPAQYFIEPRSVEELCEVVKCCQESDIPLHVLGDGSNLLIRDEGVSGAVLRLSAGDFADVSIEGTEVKAGAGAALSHVISRAVAAGLTGLEDLAGIPGTIGGAIVGNAGGRSGELGSKVTSIDVITHRGEVETIPADLINFQYRGSHIDAPVVLSATLQLESQILSPTQLSGQPTAQAGGGDGAHMLHVVAQHSIMSADQLPVQYVEEEAQV